MASGPITSWQIDGESTETVADFIFFGSKIIANGDCSHEIKRQLFLGRKAMTNPDSILKSRVITWLTKVHLVSNGFSGSHGWMWELDHKESWAPENWCFWTVVLEKTLEGPLDCKEIKPVNPKTNQSRIFDGRTDAEAKAPLLWAPDVKSWLIGKDPKTGKDWGQEEKGVTEDEIIGWHHRVCGHEFEQALGVGDGQGSLVCCSPCCCKELYMTEWLNWIDPIYSCWVEVANFFFFEIYLFILFMAVLSLCCCMWAFSSYGKWRLLSSCCVRASHCNNSSYWGTQAPGCVGSVVVACGLLSTGSVVVTNGLSCSMACGIFPDQGLNPCPLHCQAESLNTYYTRKA